MSQWTNASLFGEYGGHGWVSGTWGLFAKVVCSEADMFETVAALASVIGHGLEIALTDHVLVSSWDGTDCGTQWGKLTAAHIEKLTAGHPFQAVTGVRYSITVSSDRDGDRLVVSVTTVRSRHPDADQSPQEMDEWLIRLVRQIASAFDVIFVGAESAPVFDIRAGLMGPRMRYDTVSQRHFVPGYYWLTVLGPELLVGLAERSPTGLFSSEKLSTSYGRDAQMFRLCASSSDLHALRAQIPEFRAWLRPKLQNWMISNGKKYDLPFFEGPAVARVTRYRLSGWTTPEFPDLTVFDKVNSLLDLDTRRLGSWARLDSAREIVWKFVSLPEHADVVGAALTGAAAAIERTLREQWLGPFGAMNWALTDVGEGNHYLRTRVTDGDPAIINRLLWLALADLPNGFLVFCDKGQNPPVKPIQSLELEA